MHFIAAQKGIASNHVIHAIEGIAFKTGRSVEHGIDKNRIKLCGDSAGGHLALVTSLRLKAKGLWDPAQLILIYPMLDATASFESYTLNGMDYVITR
ncbi:alpha/beta hydrolase fold domain-containing protein, partial [Enterobacter hormaechei]|uniref:alpha/beta hydrolase fold domain-containing protein n=1 Tax=Enterobacter hormaechei TaxID=158836 RepID=UPI003CC5BF5F